MTTIETLCWVIYLCLNVPVRDLKVPPACASASLCMRADVQRHLCACFCLQIGTYTFMWRCSVAQKLGSLSRLI